MSAEAVVDLGQDHGLPPSLLRQRFRVLPSPEQTARDKAFHTSRKILVVDDCKSTREGIREQLEATYLADQGCEIHLASSGQEAIDVMQNTEFDAVVLDLHMPGKNGIDVLNEMGEKMPPTVLNPASMLKPVVADMLVDLGDYQDDQCS